MKIVRKTIGQMLGEIAGRFPNQDALIHPGVGIRYNYSLFLWEVDRVARGLMSMGIGKGDPVALWAPNIPEWLVAQMALAKIGAIFIPVDPGIGEDELFFILRQSESKAIIMARGLEDEEYVDMIYAVKEDTSSL